MKTLHIEMVENREDFDGLCDSVPLLNRDPQELAISFAEEYQRELGSDAMGCWVRWAVRDEDNEIIATGEEYISE